MSKKEKKETTERDDEKVVVTEVENEPAETPDDAETAEAVAEPEKSEPEAIEPQAEDKPEKVGSGADIAVVRVRSKSKGDTPAEKAKLGVWHDGDDGSTPLHGWESAADDEGKPVAEHMTLKDGDYVVRETSTPRGHRPADDVRFAVRDGALEAKSVRKGFVGEDGELCVPDGHRKVWPLILLAALALLALLLKLLFGTANPAKVAAIMADQVGITNNNAKAHMKVSGSTSFMSIPDATWTAAAGEQPLTIINPPTNVSTGKYFDIEPDATSFVMDYESLPTDTEATCRVRLRATDKDGEYIGYVQKDGSDYSFTHTFTPAEERGTEEVPFDLSGCDALPEGTDTLTAEVTLQENQSVDISPAIYVDYDGDADGLTGDALVQALQDDYDTECVFDPVTRDEDGNVTVYNFLIRPGHQVSSITLDRAPKVGTYKLYAYYTALDTVDHHTCNPAVVGGTTVTITEAGE